MTTQADTLLSRDKTNAKWPWAYSPAAVQELHDLVDLETTPEVAAKIIAKLREMAKAAIKIDSSFAEFYNLLEGEDDLILHDTAQFEEIFENKPLDEYVDMRLTELYDLCDEHRIWVSKM